MKLRCTFEFEIPDGETEARISENNDLYYEAWSAALKAGPCWTNHVVTGFGAPPHVTKTKVEILND